MTKSMYKCKKCGDKFFHLKEVGPHLGLYCSNEHFIGWISKTAIQSNIEKVDADVSERTVDSINYQNDNSDNKLPWEE